MVSNKVKVVKKETEVVAVSTVQLKAVPKAEAKNANISGLKGVKGVKGLKGLKGLNPLA